MKKKLLDEAIKLTGKRYEYSMISERIEGRYIRTLAKFLGISEEELLRNKHVELYYERLKKDIRNMVKKYLEHRFKYG